MTHRNPPTFTEYLTQATRTISDFASRAVNSLLLEPLGDGEVPAVRWSVVTRDPAEYMIQRRPDENCDEDEDGRGRGRGDEAYRLMLEWARAEKDGRRVRGEWEEEEKAGRLVMARKSNKRIKTSGRVSRFAGRVYHEAGGNDSGHCDPRNEEGYKDDEEKEHRYDEDEEEDGHCRAKRRHHSRTRRQPQPAYKTTIQIPTSRPATAKVATAPHLRPGETTQIVQRKTYRRAPMSSIPAPKDKTTSSARRATLHLTTTGVTPHQQQQQQQRRRRYSSGITFQGTPATPALRKIAMVPPRASRPTKRPRPRNGTGPRTKDEYEANTTTPNPTATPRVSKPLSPQDEETRNRRQRRQRQGCGGATVRFDDEGEKENNYGGDNGRIPIHAKKRKRNDSDEDDDDGDLGEHARRSFKRPVSHDANVLRTFHHPRKFRKTGLKYSAIA